MRVLLFPSLVFIPVAILGGLLFPAAGSAYLHYEQIGGDIKIYEPSNSFYPYRYHFKNFLAMDSEGSTVVLGLPYSDSPRQGTFEQGSAAVFQLQVKNRYYGWAQLGQTLVGLDDLNHFGNSVAMTEKGDMVAVGTMVEYVSADEQLGGYVLVFQYDENSSTWNAYRPRHDGRGDNEPAQHFFGYSVSLSGDGTRLAVGDANSVSIFDWCDKPIDVFGNDSRRPGFCHMYDIPVTRESDEFLPPQYLPEILLSKDGTHLLVPLDGEDYTLYGMYRLLANATFTRVNGIGRFPNMIQLTGDGSLVAVNGCAATMNRNGTMLATGSSSSTSDNVIFGAGEIEAYRMLEQLGGNIIGDGYGKKLGHSIAMSEDGYTIVAGAPNLSTLPSGYTGEAHVYGFNGTDWVKEAVIPGTSRREIFGMAVAMSKDGRRVAVGGLDEAGTPFARVYCRGDGCGVPATMSNN